MLYVKKHVKFDEQNGSLYLQMKHNDDEEWVNFSYEQVKIEKEKRNAKRVKKSKLFQSPDGKIQETVGSNNNKGKEATRTQPSRFKPVGRSDEPGPSTSGFGGSNSTWRPPARQVDDDEDMT